MLAYCYDPETGAYLNRSMEVKALEAGLTDQVPPFVSDPKSFQQFFRGDTWVIDGKPTPKAGEPGGALLTAEQIEERNQGV